MATSRVTEYFPCPVERVWQVVTDLSHTAWRSDLKQVEVLDETHFVEYTKSGYATNFTITVWEPFRRWAFTMENGNRRWAFTMENGNMSGSWEGVFESAEDGAQLHCTETVNAKHWWLHPFVPGYLKRQQRLYLDDLRRELQK